MTTLHDRLADLADAAPPGDAGPDLWAAGKQRQRRRRIQATLAVAVVVAMVGGLGALLRTPDPVPPVDAPFGELHLPRTVHAPSPWTPGTEEKGPLGPLAALALATRHERDGMWGRRSQIGIFGVSALDGSVRFLDIPGTHFQGDLVTFITLSPDGRKVGFVRYAPDQEDVVIGWGVYDTVSGDTVKLEDPEVPKPLGTDAFEIEFSDDSSYLATNYGTTNGSRDDRLVLWDVETGAQSVAEGTGHYWLPNMGSAPVGVVWSRGRATFTFEPTTGHTDEVTVPQQVVEASFGPDGRGFAYIGHRAVGPNEPARWWLYAGGDTDTAAGRRIDLDIEPGQILGWRDAHHVVVDNHRDQVRVVDVRTGESTPERLRSYGHLLMRPDFADALWANDLVDGVEPPSVSDPRSRDARLAGGTAFVLLLAGSGLWWWRRRVRA